MQANGTYDRLPWPFSISSGRLQVAPLQVDWQEVQGGVGKQRISSMSGGVSWQDAVTAVLKSLDADLDLMSLLNEGALRTDRSTLVLRDFVHGRFSDLSGQASLSNSTFSGPVSDPKQWLYQTSLKVSNLALTGERFPQLLSNDVEAEINQKEADFAGIFALFGQEIFLSGQYEHSALEQWRGKLEVNGDIREEFGAWLKERWPVVIAFPEPPFRLEKFVLNNPQPGFESILAHGTVIPLPQHSDTKVQVAVNRQPDQAMSTLTFLDGAKQGILNYQTWTDQKKRSLLTWQGELTVDTLDAFYSLPFVQSGRITGAFSRLVEQDATSYSGTVEVNEMSFQPQTLIQGLKIDALSLQGNEDTITVPQAEIALDGIPASASGTITESQGLHDLDLQLQAPNLSWVAIKKVFESYSKRDPAGEPQDKSLLDSISGRIAFDIDAFDYVKRTKSHEVPETEETHTFTARPFKGVLNLNPAGLYIDVKESKVCGINNQGRWYFGAEEGEDVVSFTSGGNPLSFEEALPCLGIKQSLINGPFSVEGQISGRPKEWRQGTITLVSSGGLIKRMNLLSQIFTAVNFTDYLTWDESPDNQGEGLPYSELSFSGHVDENNLVLDRSVIKGKGVNLSGRGTINLTDLDADLTFFIAPLKGLDWMVTNLPLIGKALGGPKESIFTFPVAVSGNIKDPEVTALAPTALGSAFFELFRDTLTLPYRIFEPDHKSPAIPEPPASE